MLDLAPADSIISLDPYGRLARRPISAALIAVLVLERLVLVIIGFFLSRSDMPSISDAPASFFACSDDAMMSSTNLSPVLAETFPKALSMKALLAS